MMEQKQSGKNNLDIKLIALDLDGTLLNNKKEISLENFKMLNKALDKNINIVLATGRPLSGLPKELINDNRIKYAICSNGASIINIKENKVIYYCQLPIKKVISIIKRLSKIDPILDVFADGKIITEKRNLERMDEFLIPENMKKYIYDTRIITDNIARYVNEEVRCIEKINLFFKDVNQRNLVREELSKIEDINITSSLNSNMEINNEKANKGAALLWLCKHLELSKEHVMACGDSENDISMLEVVGLGIAMENGSNEIKLVADSISSSNDEDGVAKAIKKYIDLT